MCHLIFYLFYLLGGFRRDVLLYFGMPVRVGFVSFIGEFPIYETIRHAVALYHKSRYAKLAEIYSKSWVR